MFSRLSANVVPFASTSQGTERTVFGGIAQSDLIDDNFTTEYLRGWGITGANDNPTKQDFNAMGYMNSALTAYLYQQGVPEWHNLQKFLLGSYTVGSDKEIYQAKTGTTGTPNQGNDPTTDLTNWGWLFETKEVTIDFASDADLTLTAAQNKNHIIRLTDTDVVLTVARNVNVSTMKRNFIVYNDTGFDQTIKTSLGTGVVVKDGNFDILYCDGTNVTNSLTGKIYAIDTNYQSNPAFPLTPVTASGHTATLYSNGIIKGSSDNGSYLAFPDGTLITLKIVNLGTLDINQATGNGYQSAQSSIGDFPIEYSSTPNKYYSKQSGIVGWITISGASANINFDTIRINHWLNSSSSTIIHATAIGEW